jgi:hypothetical protein
MTSVQKKFAAGLITLFMISCTSHTGQATKQMPDNCNQDPNLATKIQECIESKGIQIEKLCVTKDSIEVFLKVGADTPVACYVIDAVYECAQNAVGPTQVYSLTISIVSSTPNAPASLVYKGHTGIGSDPDAVRICIDTGALADEGILRFNFGVVEAKVSKDASRLGVTIDNLRVVIGKCKADKDKYNSCLQVSGTASAQKVSESRVRGIVAALVNKYTGVLRINTDNLKVLTTSGKDIRIK